MEKFAKKENITSVILNNNYTSADSLMKISNKLLTAVICSVLLLPTACQRDELAPVEPTDASQHFLDFEGLQVNHVYEVPDEVLGYVETDFQSLYLSGSEPLNGRTQATLDEISYPSIDELANLVEFHAQKYPDTDALEKKDIDLIKTHFPDLTEAEIDKNINKIAAYYEKNLQYDVIKALSKGGVASSNNGREQYVYELCNREFWIVAGRIYAADAVRDATNDARTYTEELYGFSGGGDRSDAFRHATWNMLIAKYYAQKKRDKLAGFILAADFTRAHESCNISDGHPDYDVAMDLHNNHAGRLYFSRVVTQRNRKGIFRRDEIIAPDNAIIKNDIKAMADNAIQVSKDVNSVNSINENQLVYFN